MTTDITRKLKLFVAASEDMWETWCIGTDQDQYERELAVESTHGADSKTIVCRG